MSDSGAKLDGLSARYLGLLVIVTVPSVYACIIGAYWLNDQVSPWFYWKASLVVLITLEAVYVIAVAVAVTGALASGFWLLRNGRGTSRTSLLRWLLACGSLGLGLVATESVCAIWQWRAHRYTAVPIGGFRTGRRWRAADPPLRPSIPAPAAVKPNLDFDDPPGDREIDLVMMGESSAQGVPLQKWLSIDRIVAWQLQKVISARPIRLSSLARSGDTLEAQHKRLVELRRRPDLLMIYCGHNEFKSRFAPTHTPNYYFDDELPTPPEVLVNHIEGISPLCSLIGETAEKFRLAIPPSAGATRDLIDVPVYSTSEYTALLRDFRRRLEAMVSYAERVGAVPLLIVPSSNDAGFEPNRSFLPPGIPCGEREAFQRQFLAARRLEEADLAASITRYRILLESQPGFAETHYRLARLLDRAGAQVEAYHHYIAARDLDGYPMRCMTPFQDACREVASRHGCILIDGQAYFHRIGRQGQLDDDLFQDMMHPSLRGYIALSQAVLRALKATGAFGWPHNVPVTPIDPARCAAHFGLAADTWKHLCDWQSAFNKLVLPLRHDRRLRQRKWTDVRTAAERLSQGFAPEAIGLPNVGIPEPVPMVPYGTGEANDRTNLRHQHQTPASQGQRSSDSLREPG